MPNATLISDDPTNWTLSDRTRRFKEWAAIHRQVAVAVNALAAGIVMPLPQRDVTLRFRPQAET